MPASPSPVDALDAGPAPPSELDALRFLAAAGEALAESLDLERTLQEVARLAVPVLGDLCLVDLLEDGAIRRVGAHDVRPERLARLGVLAHEHPPSLASPHPGAVAMRTGRPVLLADVRADEVDAHTTGPDHAAVIAALGMRSALAVPMSARGTVIGALTIAVTESGRRYGDVDLALAMELARRAALAIDNARLYRSAQREIEERRRVEEALQLSEQRCRAVIEQCPLSTQLIASDGLTLEVNPAWEALWGLTMDDLRGYDIRHDPQLEAVGIAPLLRRAFAGEVVELPAIRYDPDRTLPTRSRREDPARWVRAFAYPLEDGEGRVHEVVLMHEDITEKRRVQDGLQASEERVRLALEVARMNVWDWDLVEDRVVCSENAREFWGVDIGRASDFVRVIHPDDQDAVTRAATAPSPDGRYRVEYRLVHPDGGWRWVQSLARREHDEQGRPIRLVGVTVDVTERRAAEEATRLLADAGATLGASLDTRETLRQLSRCVVPRLADWCAIDLLDEQGELERITVHHVDPALVAVGLELFERYPPRRTDAPGPFSVMASGVASWAEDIPDELLVSVAHDEHHLQLIRRLGLRSYICVPLMVAGSAIGVLTLVHAEQGRRFRAADVELATDLAGRAAVSIDNTRLYERLRVEDRRKDEFLATLAHELRNPLAPLRTSVEILRRAPPGASLEGPRRIMERQLAHMVRLVDDLLDVSRITRGTIALQREPLALAELVELSIETSRPLLEAAGVSIEVALPADAVSLVGDRTRLAQVISNVLNNAAKFAPGGQVRLEAAVHEDEDDVELRIRDSGIGIPRELLAHVFEPFVQVERGGGSRGGLGIGLTLVRRLVELHGGHVRAESDGAGRGTTITMRWPRHPVEATASNPAPSATRAVDAAALPRRILVVDDNLDAGDTLADLLRLDGHEVRTASTAQQAIDVAPSFRPEVALLDIGLPGMDGLQLADHLRALPGLADLTLVAITGWGQDADRRRSREAGFHHHLTKPVDPEGLRAVLRAGRGAPAG